MTARLGIRVHPRARRERIVGWHGDGCLRIEVTAAPEDGRANQAAEELLADALGVRPGDVRVVKGRASRNKVVEVTSLTEDEVARRLGRIGASE